MQMGTHQLQQQPSVLLFKWLSLHDCYDDDGASVNRAIGRVSRFTNDKLKISDIKRNIFDAVSDKNVSVRGLKWIKNNKNLIPDSAQWPFSLKPNLDVRCSSVHHR